MAEPAKRNQRPLELDAHDDWIFDLDNTLYPSHCNLFAQMDVRMGSFISELLDVDRTEARRIQKTYLHQHGTTLNGLMIHHKIDPHHFLDYVHDLDLSVVPEDLHLREALKALPGRKLVFTNGSEAHVEKVISQLGVADCFDGVFDIAASGFVPKPHRETYDAFVKKLNVEPSRAVMFEDMAKNLVEPEAMGMSTVLVHSNGDWLGEHKDESSLFAHDDHDHIHHFAEDLSDFLHAALATDDADKES